MKSKKSKPKRARPNKDRWVNWDQLTEGEDFWDMLDDLDQKRLGEIREHEQMVKLRKKHMQRLANIKYDPEDYQQHEPYAGMCNAPEF